MKILNNFDEKTFKTSLFWSKDIKLQYSHFKICKNGDLYFFQYEPCDNCKSFCESADGGIIFPLKNALQPYTSDYVKKNSLNKLNESEKMPIHLAYSDKLDSEACDNCYQ